MDKLGKAIVEFMGVEDRVVKAKRQQVELKNEAVGLAKDLERISKTIVSYMMYNRSVVFERDGEKRAVSFDPHIYNVCGAEAHVNIRITGVTIADTEGQYDGSEHDSSV